MGERIVFLIECCDTLLSTTQSIDIKKKKGFNAFYSPSVIGQLVEGVIEYCRLIFDLQSSRTNDSTSICIVATGPILTAVTSWNSDAQNTASILRAVQKVRPSKQELNETSFRDALRLCVNKLSSSIESNEVLSTRMRLIVLMRYQPNVPASQFQPPDSTSKPIVIGQMVRDAFIELRREDSSLIMSNCEINVIRAAECDHYTCLFSNFSALEALPLVALGPEFGMSCCFSQQSFVVPSSDVQLACWELRQLHDNLFSMVVVGIPMKRQSVVHTENVSVTFLYRDKRKINASMWLQDRSAVHAGLMRLGRSTCLKRRQNNVHWAHTPKEFVFEHQACSTAYKATTADLSSKLVIPLIKSLLNQHNPLTFSTNDNAAISHVLRAQGSHIYMHCIDEKLRIVPRLANNHSPKLTHDDELDSMRVRFLGITQIMTLRSASTTSRCVNDTTLADTLTATFQFGDNVVWNRVRPKLYLLMCKCQEALLLPTMSDERAAQLYEAFDSLFAAYTRNDMLLLQRNGAPQATSDEGEQLYASIWLDLRIIATCLRHRSRNHSIAYAKLNKCFERLREATRSLVAHLSVVSTHEPKSITRARTQRSLTELRMANLKRFSSTDTHTMTLKRLRGYSPQTPTLLEWYRSRQMAQQGERRYDFDGWKSGFIYSW